MTGDPIDTPRLRELEAELAAARLEIEQLKARLGAGELELRALARDRTPEEVLREETRPARIDPLTGLPNRRGFEEGAAMMLDHLGRQGQVMTVGIVDVNGLKRVNRMLGEAEGDLALKVIAATIQGAIRSLDVLGRVDGDEFAVLLPGMPASPARQFFDRLAERLTEACQGSAWGIGFSVGAATFTGRLPALADAVDHAEALMREARAAGTTRVVYAEIPAA
ncbi:MAG: GGDEF domain-containing protein [Deltaproteobacteria bacterium]|nr:GGDEF domain-containing protein [Deltaproteobacteria bacterium]